MRILIIALSIFFSAFLIGCGDDGTDGKDGEPTVIYVYPDDYAYSTYSASGKAQDGPFYYGADVRFYSQDIGAPGIIGMYQTGSVLQTITDSDFGHYEFPGGVTSPIGEVFIDGNPYNELSYGIDDRKTLNALINFEEPGPKNVNPLTTIRTPILRYLYNTTYINDASTDRWNNSRAEAESRILTFFNMPALPGQHFEDLDIEGATKGDEVLTAVNIMLLWDSAQGRIRTVAEQIQLITQIATPLKTDPAGNLILKAQVAQDGSGFADKIIPIRDNLKNHYVSLGHESFESPRFWNHFDFDLDGIRNDDDPDSMIDIIVDPHELKWHDRLSHSCTVSFAGNSDGSSSWRFFAEPKIYPDGIQTTKYYGTSVTGDYMAIYSVDDNGTVDESDDTPLAPLPIFNGGATFVSKIPVNYLVDSYQDASDDTYSNLPSGFQADISGNSIVPGTKYFQVMFKDANYLPTGLCPNATDQQLPFAYNLVSGNGTTWELLLNGTYFVYNWSKEFGAD